MKAIILAAGKGQRLTGPQGGVPKVLRTVNQRPMLSYVLDGIGFIPREQTAIVVGYGKEQVIEAMGVDYLYPVQERQLGTGHAAGCAREAFADLEGDVLVCSGDMPLISRRTYEGVIDTHRKTGADCTVLTAVAPHTGLRYGRILREKGRLADIVEHRDCTAEQLVINEFNVGVYVFRAAVLFQMLEQLSPRDGIFALTDLPRLLLGQFRVETHTIYNPNEIYGIDTPEELAFCEQILQRLQHEARAASESPWFGTGGWRAIIADEFTRANVRILAQAISDDMKSKGWREIVIGYDRRFLSDKAAAWTAEVFAGNGIDVYFINRIAPTPLIMFTVKNSGAKYGIAITASHNPAEYNGIKVFTEGGRDASPEVTDVFEAIIAQGVSVSATGFDEGLQSGRIRIIDPNNEYIDTIIAMVDMDAIRSKNLRVLLDPMFGVSKTALQTILMTARCDVDIINERHDALFGGRLPSPTAATLTKLRDMVVERGYDLGIGTDGDADRVGIIDDRGAFVHPNDILSLLYYYLLEYKGWRGDCVRNLATTHLLDRIAEAYGQHCHEVPVGFKHISSKMEETGALIGGESSGGLTIRGHILGKDGIFASSLIVEMISVTGKRIPQLRQELEERFGSWVMTELDFRFSDEKKQALQNLLFREKRLPDFGRTVEKVSYRDGCKVYFGEGGWIITRFSGTEPLLRVFCEMERQSEAEAVSHRMREFLGL